MGQGFLLSRNVRHQALPQALGSWL